MMGAFGGSELLAVEAYRHLEERVLGVKRILGQLAVDSLRGERERERERWRERD